MPIFTYFIITLYHFYAFTNLLTRCHSARCLFSVVFGFRKVIKKIFSELDETNCQVPIFPDTTRRPKVSRRRAMEPAHHVVARVPPPPCRHVVWGPRASTNIAPSPINTSLGGNPKYLVNIPQKVPSRPSSSTLDRQGSEALPDTLPEERSSPEALHHHVYLRSDA